VLVAALAAMEELDVHVVTLEKGVRQPCVEHEGSITIHRLPGRRWPLVADIWAGPGRRRLLRYLRGLQCDVVHAHETHGLALGNSGLPIVFTVHGFNSANLPASDAPRAGLRSRLWRLSEQRGLARHRHIISISPYVRGMIEPLTTAEIFDIENPVEEEFFAIGRAEEPGRVLCVGWIDERKNTLGSVESFARALRRGAQGTLAIAGEPKQATYMQRVRELVASHGLEDRVTFLGHLNRQRLRQELARAAVMLLPSRQENAPMAIGEAMAAGVPVIASNRCGMPYMVIEGQTGYLIEPDDCDQIADRLCRLLGDAALRRDFSLAARQHAREHFHPQQVARKTLEVYRRVAAAGAVPSLQGAGT
jgi:glycosyltransferase involved in cell wall biosynthesis